jgi:hypothetical protein
MKRRVPGKNCRPLSLSADTVVPRILGRPHCTPSHVLRGHS